MNRKTYYPISLYTLKESQALENAESLRTEVTFTENKIWRTGYNEFLKCQGMQQSMLIFFAEADQRSCIKYVAEIKRIEIDQLNSNTKYTFTIIKKLKACRPLSFLRLYSNGTQLSDDYKMSYALVVCPSDIELILEEDFIPSIKSKPKLGKEYFQNDGKVIDKTILNFWQWAYSDLVDNTARGILAEYIVALALEIDHHPQIGWKSYDLDYNNLKIEVKCSAYLQTWKQKKLSKIMFSISKSKAWDSENNVYEDSSKRQSDIYIFCVLEHKVADTLNPMALDQWGFYVVETSKLDLEKGDVKSISLDGLIKLNAERVAFGKLKEQVDSMFS